jgi:hypothetical protein
LGPAYRSLIPTLVGKEHLPNAVALNSIRFNLAASSGQSSPASRSRASAWSRASAERVVLFVIAAIPLRDVHVPPMAKA